VHRAGELLKEFLRRQGVSGNEPSASLFGGWARFVQPPLLDHSRPVDLKNGVLWVEVDHPGWMQLLHLQQARILRQVRQQYPQLQVRGLSCRVNLRFTVPSAGPGVYRGPDAETPGVSPPPAAGTRVAADEEARDGEEAAAALSDVGEPELRTLLSRLFRGAIERARRRGEAMPKPAAPP
jgi:hypothetical protein